MYEFFGMIILNLSINAMQNLCYVNRDSFIMYIKSEDFYEDIADDVEKRFDASKTMTSKNHYQLEKIKKVNGLMKDELSKRS